MVSARFPAESWRDRNVQKLIYKKAAPKIPRPGLLDVVWGADSEKLYQKFYKSIRDRLLTVFAVENPQMPLHRWFAGVRGGRVWYAKILHTGAHLAVIGFPEFPFSCGGAEFQTLR